jgi:hypothetical protein
VASQSCMAPTRPQSSSREVTLYNALNNLSNSMRRSGLSRAQVIRHGENVSKKTKKPSASTTSLCSFAGLLSGKQTTLTPNLEQSRKQLRMCMMLLNSNQPL